MKDITIRQFVTFGLCIWSTTAQAETGSVSFTPGNGLTAHQLETKQKQLVSVKDVTLTDQTLKKVSISGLSTTTISKTNTLKAYPVGVEPKTVKASIVSSVTAADGTTSIWPHVFQTISATGYGATDPVWGTVPGRINLFVGMKCLAGSSDCWAENQMMYAGTGFRGHGHGSEIDIENMSSDRDPSASDNVSITGLEITGLSQYPISYGIDIVSGGTNSTSGNKYVAHEGIAIMGGAAKDNSFVDVGDASTSLHIMGRHVIGLDLSYATITGSAISLDATQALNFHNKGTGSLFKGLSSDGSTVILGPESPSNNIGYGGAGGYAFLNVSNNITGATMLLSAGSAPDINLVLSAKGNGVVVVTAPLQVPSVSVTTKMTVPVVATAPAGNCTAGQMEVSGLNFYVCVTGGWKRATLN